MREFFKKISIVLLQWIKLFLPLTHGSYSNRGFHRKTTPHRWSGEGACASPENYNEEIGNKIAFENAREKIWKLEGYLLKEKLYQKSLNKQEL